MKTHGKNIMREIVVGTARRLRQLVRPLDVVARLSNEQFAIVTHQTDIMQANAVTYRRIYDALNVKALKTSKGYVNIRAANTFSYNDFAANLGIVLAGGLVAWLGTNWPDLVVGVIVAGIAAWGGIDILRDAHGEHHKAVHTGK